MLKKYAQLERYRLFSYTLPKFKNTGIRNESCDSSKDSSDIVLCDTSFLNHDLKFSKLKTLFVSDHETNYYLSNNEIMIPHKTGIPIALILNSYTPYGIPFDPNWCIRKSVAITP